MDRISLLVNGSLYSGWKEVSFGRSLKTLCGGFTVSLTDKWLGQSKPWPILPGDKCTFLIDDDEELSGYVDDFNPSFDESARTLSVTGRDITGDVVDCSVENPTTYRNVKLDRLVELIAKPFGISVTAAVDVGKPFPSWTIGPGENAFDAIDKAARERGVIAITDNKGGILLTRAGTKKCSTALVQGQNATSGSGMFSMKDRFSLYTVTSQTTGVDEDSPDTAMGIKESAVDEGVPRYRPLCLSAESQTDALAARNRVRWEATRRAGEGSSATVNVPGFRQKDGRLWRINELVMVKVPWLGIESAELLITGIGMRKSGEGTVTTIEIMLPQAFQLLEKVSAQDALGRLLFRESKK